MKNLKTTLKIEGDLSENVSGIAITMSIADLKKLYTNHGVNEIEQMLLQMSKEISIVNETDEDIKILFSKKKQQEDLCETTNKKKS